MKLDTYAQKAAETAEPRAYDQEYLLPGLLGEVGELFAEFAKAHWHETDRSSTIVDEYGDVAWLTAILLSTYGIGDSEVESLVHRYRSMPDTDTALDFILSRAAAVYSSQEPQRPVRAAMLWDALEQNAEVVTGVSWEQVLTRNTEKLAERAAAGELKTHA